MCIKLEINCFAADTLDGRLDPFIIIFREQSFAKMIALLVFQRKTTYSSINCCCAIRHQIMKKIMEIISINSSTIINYTIETPNDHKLLKQK
jgi:hypothetical protein